jgi:hypothetical protein
MPETIADQTLTVRDDKNEPAEMSGKDAQPDVIRDAKPYRTFRWYLG